VNVGKAVSPTFTSRNFFSNPAAVLADSDEGKSSIKKKGAGGNLHVQFDLNSDMGSEDGSAGSDGVVRPPVPTRNAPIYLYDSSDAGSSNVGSEEKQD
jgi:hypothetical protein